MKDSGVENEQQRKHCLRFFNGTFRAFETAGATEDEWQGKWRAMLLPWQGKW
jgi:hypothetical protein